MSAAPKRSQCKHSISVHQPIGANITQFTWYCCCQLMPVIPVFGAGARRPAQGESSQLLQLLQTARTIRVEKHSIPCLLLILMLRLLLLFSMVFVRMVPPGFPIALLAVCQTLLQLTLDCPGVLLFRTALHN